MFVNLNRLNESLERLYESNSSLTEAFDESFPKWLKDRLVTINKFHTGDWSVRRGIPYDQRPDYINARDEDKWNSSSKSLFDKALSAGIDFSKTKVVEGPVPEKRTDERLKNENYIPIWLFPNGQVYIEGLNGSEIYMSTGKAFKYMPMKDKIENASGFAYVDKTKIDPDSITNKRKERSEMRKELLNLPYYARKGTAEYDKFSKDYWTRNFDKSGYPILNPERYKRELEKLAGKKIYQELEKFYNKIVDAQRKVADAYSQIDPFDRNDDTAGKLRDIMLYVRYTADNYNDYMRKVDDYVNGGYSEDYKARKLGDIVRMIKENDNMRHIDEIGSNIFLTDIDWD